MLGCIGEVAGPFCGQEYLDAPQAVHSLGIQDVCTRRCLAATARAIVALLYASMDGAVDIIRRMTLVKWMLLSLVLEVHEGRAATYSPSGHQARRNALTRASAASFATREAGANKWKPWKPPAYTCNSVCTPARNKREA